MNDEENAFADFNTAIKLDGRIAESWANQALIYERRGDKAKAAKSYQQAVRLDPNYKPPSTAWRAQKGPETAPAEASIVRRRPPICSSTAFQR